MDGRRDWKVKLPRSSGRIFQFLNNNTITILGIPHIVVLEAVHVHVERAIVIDVDIRNEEL